MLTGHNDTVNAKKGDRKHEHVFVCVGEGGGSGGRVYVPQPGLGWSGCVCLCYLSLRHFSQKMSQVCFLCVLQFLHTSDRASPLYMQERVPVQKPYCGEVHIFSLDIVEDPFFLQLS